MELDADEPRKFQGPPDKILGQPTWVGGGGGAGKILVGGRFSLEKRSERPWPLWGRGELYVSFHDSETNLDSDANLASRIAGR